MQVQEIMSSAPVSLETEEPVAAAARLMRERNIGAMPVCDASGKLVGMLTDRDIVIRCIASGRSADQTRVSDIMTTGAVVAETTEPLDDALQRMEREQIRRLPVTKDGRLVGMLSLADVARSSRLAMETAEALSKITSNICRK
ncbi:MAG: CBS domain-containing protein [Clostridia bacterium]|nr:CBS domain-containing protein [Clostridia bacterium]